MSEVQKEQLIDEYEEVTLKLFMEKYEEAEGALLWNEYQTALRNNELPEMPADLDIRCKNLIQEYIAHNDSKNKD